MTRQEQIKKAATAKSRGETPYYYDAFVEGAEWADAHPHWISVEDELPKAVINDNVTKLVLTYSTDGYIRLDRYMHYYHKWVGGASEVTHWMPMPAPPIVSKMENTGKKGGAQ